MKRRDLFRSAFLLVPSLLLPAAGLSPNDSVPEDHQPDLDEPPLRFFTVNDVYKEYGSGALNVYINGKEVSNHCTGMCASPLPNIKVEGWCELIVGFDFELDEIIPEIHTGTIWWEPNGTRTNGL